MPTNHPHAPRARRTSGRSLARWRALAPAAVLALLAVASGGAVAPPALKAGVFDPPRKAPDFSLQGTDGHVLRFSQYRGKVVLLAFGYSSCPVICPTTLTTFARALRELGADARGVQVVYITVDAERDVPERLKAFVAHFDPRILGGTGTAAQLAAVRQSYGISAKRVPAGDTYAYAHSTFTYLIDREGRIRALMPYGHSADDYVHDLRILLSE